MDNAEVYASLGAGNAVITSQDEHEEAMLALDVAVRDGDDLISVAKDEEGYGSFEEDENNQRVLVNSEGEQEDTEGEPAESEGGEELPEIGETPEGLTNISAELKENIDGFYEMAQCAIDKGLLTDEQINSFLDEYEEKGTLSEDVLNKLEEAGFTKAFVKSYIKGQEALANKYEQQIYDYAGGKDNYAKIMGHLQAENPALIESFVKAVNDHDLQTIQGILKSARDSASRKYGKPAERSIAKKAVAQPQSQPQETKGFASRDEMVKAMSDKRYGRDKAYTDEVVRKVALMK
ncbi:capsid and scaffold protein [Pasteurella phage PHB01]|uniref:Capsid and scaffold protein n=1 Tax=Pasteurella phage PHB01 TaxID=2006930 RepID=A0A218M4F0_9CAUD|nr:head assembly [Pasteurella phage PHB01]ASD51042.1 capsid and scaffold protein [Pasteurella phage PHB01]